MFIEVFFTLGIYHIHLESAGYEDGIYCKMEVNGVDYAPNTIGHNVVVINLRTKEIKTAVFDTWGNSESVSFYLFRDSKIIYGFKLFQHNYILFFDDDLLIYC